RLSRGGRELALPAPPYLAGLGAWSFYILQSPGQFWSQFAGNASGIASEFTEMNRWSGLSAPLKAFYREIVRYLGAFDWYSAPNFWVRLQLSILVVYALGIVGALCTPSIRRRPGYRALL